MRPHRILACVLLLVGCGVGAESPSNDPAASAKKDNGRAGDTVASPNQTVAGRSYREWNAAYWVRMLAVPTAMNPSNDATGAFCAVAQDGPVWFLGGYEKGDSTQHCAIPADKVLFVNVMNSEWDNAPGNNCGGDTSVAGLADCVHAWQADVKTMTATIDGVAVPSVFDYDTGVSTLFPVTYPADNPFGVPGGSYQGIADGYALLLHPLSPGAHVIQVHAETVVVPALMNTPHNFTATYEIQIQ